MSFGSILYTLLFEPLQLIFEVIYYLAYRVIQNPGITIIALSLAINLLVLPLYRRADAMQEEERLIEAALKPGIDHIKKTFKGDERTMMLQTYYRQNHYSPLQVLKSAVSLLLQIPFFIAAYQFLSNLDLLQDIGFGPITNLGAPDGLLVIGGLTINLLPIIMTVINIISAVIYTKGHPLKTKIQLYAMAAFFLVFLYNSPAGLVFYWTLNNVFSLVKTIFYKIKNPQKVLRILACVCGIGIFSFGIRLLLQAASWKKVFAIMLIGLALCLPILIHILNRKWPIKKKYQWPSPDQKLFYSGVVFLALLTGLLIPSALIGDSPQEFFSLVTLTHPAWYVVSALLIAFGLFVIWGGVFYTLFSDKIKVVFERIVWIGCGIAIVDYLFFGKDFGIITSNLIIEKGFSLTSQEIGINLVVILALIPFMYFLLKRFRKIAKGFLLVACLTMTCMGGINMVGIAKSIDKIDTSVASKQPQITLSKSGQNVIVFMLDRALGTDVPYIFEEKPKLKRQFSGFTNYTNVISYGRFTNFGVPALFGGYEYTPLEMNLRDTESLADKHNEALKVMPVLFDEAGYNVTVCDPPYAGYQNVPDFSIYDDYPNINTYITQGNVRSSVENTDSLFRNMFCYSIMKSVPSIIQITAYNNGNYNLPSRASALSDTNTVPAAFMNSYLVLDHLDAITRVVEKKENTLLLIDNDMTHNHEGVILQEPDYVPASIVDNSTYHQNTLSLNGKVLHNETDLQIAHYHVNMAAFLKLGEWFDYLKKKGVYDNTRIIIASDHGAGFGQSEELVTSDLDLAYFHPVLLVKDFKAKGEIVTSDAFMTQSDVPTLATDNLIENPTNPFTGKSINSKPKDASVQYVFASDKWSIGTNNGNTFLPGDWYSVHDNIWDRNNWQLVKKDAVYPYDK